MSILGINNRTENWKTARHFAPLLLDGCARVELARKLGEDPGTSRADVDLELFWKGMRDYVDKVGKSEKDDLNRKCAKAYLEKDMFSSLRDDIMNFSKQPTDQDSRGGLLEPKEQNYAVSNPDSKKGLWDNLYNTEIDIVLETPSRLFIGEAKGEEALGARGRYVLVHQLIRQYVTANILLHVMEIRKKIVPFMVVDEDKRGRVLKQGQVRFMIDCKGWLEEKNVLTWGDIRSLQP